jgi:hypothetical protein
MLAFRADIHKLMRETQPAARLTPIVLVIIVQLHRATIEPQESKAVMANGITKEESALLRNASEMFYETGCVPGFYGEEVPAEKIVPDAKEYISGAIEDPEAIYDPEIWDAPGFALVLSWLAQKWRQKCHKLAHRRSKNPEQYLTKVQQKTCLDAAAVELIREITQQGSLN